jgi:hypothetical protein
MMPKRVWQSLRLEDVLMEGRLDVLEYLMHRKHWDPITSKTLSRALELLSTREDNKQGLDAVGQLMRVMSTDHPELYKKAVQVYRKVYKYLACPAELKSLGVAA